MNTTGEKVTEAEETIFLQSTELKKTIFGNSAVSINADGRKTARDMVEWPLREGSLQRIQSFQNNMQNHAKDLEFTPATNTVCRQVSSGVLPAARLGTSSCAHSGLWPIPALGREAHP